MDMCVEGSASEWFNSMPGTGRIYHLINEAMDVRNTRRISAMIALGETGDPRAVRSLVDCCSDMDPEIRGHATDALHKLRSGRAVDALIERLKDKCEQPVTRQHAADALATIRSFSAIDGLKDRSLDLDEEPDIRSYVVEVMDRTGIR